MNVSQANWFQYRSSLISSSLTFGEASTDTVMNHQWLPETVWVEENTTLAQELIDSFPPPAQH